MEHVRVRQKDVRPLADLPALLGLRVAVVDRRLHALQPERLERTGLILRERLRRIEVERPALRLPCEQVEHGQVEREALAARGPGRDDQVAAGACRFPRLGLVPPEGSDPEPDERRGDARVEVVRKRLRAPCPSRLRAEVGELLALQDLQPGGFGYRRQRSASVYGYSRSQGSSIRSRRRPASTNACSKSASGRCAAPTRARIPSGLWALS